MSYWDQVEKMMYEASMHVLLFGCSITIDPRLDSPTWFCNRQDCPFKDLNKVDETSGAVT